MTKKNNIRSIRFSDEIMEMIEQQPGNNFTQKFEYLVTRCIFELPEKEKELEQLNKKIQEQREEISKNRDLIYNLGRTHVIIGERLEQLYQVISSTFPKWEK